VKRHLVENIYDYLPWIFKYSTDRKIYIFSFDVKYDFIWGEISFWKSYIYRDYIFVKRFTILSNLVYLFIR
jgi:hypothetical protein